MTLANDQTSQSLSILVCKIVPTLIKLLGGITESLPTKFLTQGQLGSKHSKGISYYFLSAEASEEPAAAAEGGQAGGGGGGLSFFPWILGKRAEPHS